MHLEYIFEISFDSGDFTRHIQPYDICVQLAVSKSIMFESAPFKNLPHMGGGLGGWDDESSDHHGEEQAACLT